VADITLEKNGFIADSSKTYVVGDAPPAARRLVRVAREAMWQGIRQVRPGAHLGDIGFAIERHAKRHGYSVVREFCGHGIGREMHEEPQVLNFGRPGTGMRLREGMVFTIADDQSGQPQGVDERRRLDGGGKRRKAFRPVRAYRRGDGQRSRGAHASGRRERDGEPHALILWRLRAGFAPAWSAPRNARLKGRIGILLRRAFVEPAELRLPVVRGFHLCRNLQRFRSDRLDPRRAAVLLCQQSRSHHHFVRHVGVRCLLSAIGREPEDRGAVGGVRAVEEGIVGSRATGEVQHQKRLAETWSHASLS